MEFFFMDYGISSNQVKYRLLPRDDMIEFDLISFSMEMDKNLKLQVCPSEFQEKVKEVIINYCDLFF